MSKIAFILWMRKIGDSIEAYDRISHASDMWRYCVTPNVAGALAGLGYYLSQIDQSFGTALQQFYVDPTLILVFFLIEGISFVAHFGAGIWHGKFWARILSWLTRSFVYVILLSAGAVLTSVIAVDDPVLGRSIIVWISVAYGLIEIGRYALLTLAGSEPKRAAWIEAAKKTITTALSFEKMDMMELRRRAHHSVDELADEGDAREKEALQENQP